MAHASADNRHHEIDGRPAVISRGSDRGFGLTLAVVGLAAGLSPLRDGRAARLPLVAAAATFVVIALFWPRVLRPFALAWFRLGLLFHRVTGPVVLAAVYFLVLTPTALALRLLGRDPLRLRRDPNAASYWIDRSTPASSMERLF